jgi:hypothetical protein
VSLARVVIASRALLPFAVVHEPLPCC